MFIVKYWYWHGVNFHEEFENCQYLLHSHSQIIFQKVHHFLFLLLANLSIIDYLLQLFLFVERLEYFHFEYFCDLMFNYFFLSREFCIQQLHHIFLLFLLQIQEIFFPNLSWQSLMLQEFRNFLRTRVSFHFIHLIQSFLHQYFWEISKVALHQFQVHLFSSHLRWLDFVHLQLLTNDDLLHEFFQVQEGKSHQGCLTFLLLVVSKLLWRRLKVLYCFELFH